MNSNRILSIFIIAQALIIMVLSYRHQKRGSELINSEIEHARIIGEFERAAQSRYEMQAIDLAHIGQSITWPEELVGTGSTDLPAEEVGGFRLVVYLSERSCNVCQDQMISFANEVHQQVDAVRVTGVVETASARYVRRLVRSNAISYEIFHDPVTKFAKVNGLIQAPSAFLLFDNRVLVSHYPSPSFPEASEPFYDAVVTALER